MAVTQKAVTDRGGAAIGAADCAHGSAIRRSGRRLESVAGAGSERPPAVLAVRRRMLRKRYVQMAAGSSRGCTQDEHNWVAAGCGLDALRLGWARRVTTNEGFSPEGLLPRSAPVRYRGCPIRGELVPMATTCHRMPFGWLAVTGHDPCPRKPVKLERCGMRPAFCQERNPVKTSWMRDAVRVFLAMPDSIQSRSQRQPVSPCAGAAQERRARRRQGQGARLAPLQGNARQGLDMHRTPDRSERQPACQDLCVTASRTPVHLRPQG